MIISDVIDCKVKVTKEDLLKHFVLSKSVHAGLARTSNRGFHGCVPFIRNVRNTKRSKLRPKGRAAENVTQ